MKPAAVMLVKFRAAKTAVVSSKLMSVAGSNVAHAPSLASLVKVSAAVPPLTVIVACET